MVETKPKQTIKGFQLHNEYEYMTVNNSLNARNNRWQWKYTELFTKKPIDYKSHLHHGTPLALHVDVDLGWESRELLELLQEFIVIVDGEGVRKVLGSDSGYDIQRSLVCVGLKAGHSLQSHDCVL